MALLRAWRERRQRRALAITCQDAVGLMTDYLEGALADQERARFEQHLRHCPVCAEVLEQLRTTSATLAELPPEPTDPAVREELIALYRATRPTD